MDYALNAYNVPTVGYAGEEDPAIQGTINIREQLVKAGFQFTAERADLARRTLRCCFSPERRRGTSSTR